MPLRVVHAADAARRLGEARRFVESFAPATELLLVGATREAVDDFARALSPSRGATFGLHRFSLAQLAARLASLELARAGLAPGTRLGMEAVAARATFEALQAGALRYVAPVARLRGFARTLAATLHDLRLERVDPAVLARRGAAAEDLEELARRFDEQLAEGRLADRAVLLATAVQVIENGRAALRLGCPLVLLDVTVHAGLERDFAAALVAVSSSGLATVPAGDERTLDALARLPGAEVVEADDGGGDGGELGRVRRYLFALDVAPVPPVAERPIAPGDQPSVAQGFSPVPDLDRRVTPYQAPSTKHEAPSTGSVSFFSAPGEGRESVEVARRILREAARGVPFDEMAVLVRAPLVYAGLLETALRRAGIPAWFARGTASPDPAGRAFLALLACAGEQLSARRFSEYLSLGQVPQLDASGAPPRDRERWVPPADEETPLPAPAAAAAGGQLSLLDVIERPPAPPIGALGQPTPDLSGRLDPGHAGAPATDSDAPVLEGTLRAPWNWDRLLVESAVIGGRDRWARRLEGLARELRLRRDELAADELESPRLRRVERDLGDLEHLRRFALPVIDALVALSERARWGAWIAALERLAPMVLRRPDRVLAVVAELKPMAAVGPVALDEVRHVLTERLTLLREEPPPRRYGGVFVGRPEQARGGRFRVVFVPGLAERLFPQRPREDPLLLGGRRAGRSVTQRGTAGRRALRHARACRARARAARGL